MKTPNGLAISAVLWLSARGLSHRGVKGSVRASC